MSQQLPTVSEFARQCPMCGVEYKVGEKECEACGETLLTEMAPRRLSPTEMTILATILVVLTMFWASVILSPDL